MFQRMYRAYCRSVVKGQVSCDPRVLIIGIVVVLTLVLGAGNGLRGHGNGIMHVLDCAGAFALTMAAAGLLILAVRAVAAASGHHADPATLPVQAPPRACSVPVPPARPVPAPSRGEPVYSLTLRPPGPEAAAMAAEADAISAGDLDVLVSARGTIFELDETGGPEAGS